MKTRQAEFAENDTVMIWITIGNREDALALAKILVEKRLAACVNVLPGAVSVYAWKGEVCEEPECLLAVKTSGGKVEELKAALADHHPYEVPEFAAFATDRVSEEYASWVFASTRAE